MWSRVSKRNAGTAGGALPPAGRTRNGVSFTLGGLVKVVLGLSALATVWFFLAPTQLGGSSSYVITYGTSMQPSFHAGDLAVVRQDTSYRVGEIVAYRNTQLGGHTVLHRIIGIDGGHYIFKGDNNSFVDSFHPDRSQLLGQLWFHVPAAGRYLGMLHGPRLFLIVGVLALLLIGGAAFSRHERKGGRRPEPVAGGSPMGSFGMLPIAALAGLVAFAGLGALSFTRPVSARGSSRASTPRTAASATTRRCPAARRSTARTRSRPASRSSCASRTRRTSTSPTASTRRPPIRSPARSACSPTSPRPNGWKRTLRLSGTQTFSGDKVTVSGVLDFARVNALLAKVGQLSNVTSGTYTLTLKPHVRVQGAVAGDQVKDSFSPTLGFLLDSFQLQLQPGTIAGPSSTSQLTQSTSGSGPVTVANTVSLLKLKLQVTEARRVALFGGGASLVLLLAGLALARSRRPRSERDEIEQLFGDLIVPVTETPRGLELPTVTVGSIEGLVRVAEQAGSRDPAPRERRGERLLRRGQRLRLHLRAAGRGDGRAGRDPGRQAAEPPDRGLAEAMRRGRPTRRLVAAFLVLAALLGGVVAGKVATASNTVPAGKVGQGSSATSTYTISSIAYTLNANRPQNIDQVAFTISPTTARVVKARLFNAGSWYSCTNTSGSVTCATTSPQGSATTAANLTVVATQ